MAILGRKEKDLIERSLKIIQGGLCRRPADTCEAAVVAKRTARIDENGADHYDNTACMDVNWLESVHDHTDIHLVPNLHRVKPHGRYIYDACILIPLGLMDRNELELHTIRIGCQKVPS
ncbi:hypothetical protein Y032_0093g2619 [Ancylostoma ceylanicum]|uniref:Uncharacterized protein n=1 Tax=Ancylostoma ceylanicum TaxID=53326 RepID=A0A016TKH9_9BILA|nr:hypothetical protein Y032_0093g2619 [Ancylostoma ceylanicum]